ncbi:MAG: hypothetical protein JWO94_2537, partial [Verrucomicrobiaceae bacterium]|nr:hypothetical protein [Verrucomicrobiaceae bacterium]
IPEFSVTVLGFDGVTAQTGGKGFLPWLGQGTFHDGAYAVETRNTFSHDKPVDGLVVDVQAKATLVYNGKTYLLPLYPADGLSSWQDNKEKGRESKNGLARDFVLKIAGLKPGNDNLPDLLKTYALQNPNNYYGACLDLDDWDQGGNLRMKIPAEGVLVLTLEPQGLLLDGSTGKTITRELPLKALGTDAGHVLDLPVGPYRVQAKVMNNGTATPLLVQVTWGDKAWTEAVTVDFPPFTLGGGRTELMEGVGRQTLKLKLPN